MRLPEKLMETDPAGRLLPGERLRFFADLPGGLNLQALPEAVRAMLLERAEAMLSYRIPLLPASLNIAFEKVGDRAQYEDLYFSRRNALMFLLLGEAVGRAGRYVGQLIDVLWAILEETTWVIPAHQSKTDALPKYDGAETDNLDLFSAETGALVAMTLFLLRSELDAVSVNLTPRMERMLRERVLHPLTACDDLFWMQGGNNWTPWIISNIYTVLMALPMENAEREAAVRRTLPMLAKFAGTYHDDGGCDEGPSYWGKAGAALFDCLELLYDLSGGRLDFFSDPLLRAMGEYVPKAYIHGLYYLNFADAPGKLHTDGALLYRFGRRTGSALTAAFGAAQYQGPDAQKKALENTPIEEDVRPVLDATSIYRSIKNLHLAPASCGPLPVLQKSYLDGLQVLAVRECPASDKGLYFAIKGGHNAENHNHNDVGSFVVYLDGEPLFLDVGVGTYTKFTFSEERWKIFSMQSSYHNLFEVDGVQQPPGAQYRARSAEYDEAAGALTLDLTEVCPPEAGIVRWTRTGGLAGGVVSVRDRFELDRPRPVRWQLMTLERPEATGEGTALFAGAALRFDPSLRLTIEEHPFSDPRFVGTWNTDRFYRLVLETQKPVQFGAYEMNVAHHG